MTGTIFDIQRYSIHDGHGIRTTVFLKGCPLHCFWCHNPEAVSLSPDLFFTPEKCIGCGRCMEVCPEHAHLTDPEKGHIVDRSLCKVCGTCAEECCARALQLAGRNVTVDEVIDEVLRDKPFYDTSGGGMTLSGGEPLMQAEFALQLLRRAKESSLHCVVDTSGAVPRAALESVLPYVDSFLYDIKETDAERHREYTGQTNEQILFNLRFLHDRGASILLRLPVIPGLNDRDDHFRRVAALMESLPGIEGCEIMPYHSLGVGKRTRLGIDPGRLTEVATPSRETVASWIEALRKHGATVINEQ